MRARKILEPPEGVSIRLDSTSVVAEGRAGIEWAEFFKRTAPAIAGIDAVDTLGLEIMEQV